MEYHDKIRHKLNELDETYSYIRKEIEDIVKEQEQQIIKNYLSVQKSKWDTILFELQHQETALTLRRKECLNISPPSINDLNNLYKIEKDLKYLREEIGKFKSIKEWFGLDEDSND